VTSSSDFAFGGDADSTSTTAACNHRARTGAPAVFALGEEPPCSKAALPLTTIAATIARMG